MFAQFEDASIVKSQSFPDGIATLDRRIKWTDTGLVAMEQAAVDVDQQVAVFLIELLEHFLQKSIGVEPIITFAAAIIHIAQTIRDGIRCSRRRFAKRG